MYDEKAYKVKARIGQKFCIYSRTGDALEDIKTHIFEGSTDEMSISIVKMTDDELSKIPDFDGF